MTNIQPISNEDLIVWPNGTVCMRSELQEYHWMSDDYIVVSVNDPSYQLYMEQTDESP